MWAKISKRYFCTITGNPRLSLHSTWSPSRLLCHWSLLHPLQPMRCIISMKALHLLPQVSGPIKTRKSSDSPDKPQPGVSLAMQLDQPQATTCEHSHRLPLTLQSCHWNHYVWTRCISLYLAICVGFLLLHVEKVIFCLLCLLNNHYGL